MSATNKYEVRQSITDTISVQNIRPVFVRDIARALCQYILSSLSLFFVSIFPPPCPSSFCHYIITAFLRVCPGAVFFTFLFFFLFFLRRLRFIAVLCLCITPFSCLFGAISVGEQLRCNDFIRMVYYNPGGGRRLDGYIFHGFYYIISLRIYHRPPGSWTEAARIFHFRPG